MGLASGTRIGSYEIQAAIGAGGMGEVYRARDTKLDRHVAIKVLSLGAPRVLFDLRYAFGSGITIPNYDISPDGQRFVMVKDESSSGRLNVVLNWAEELRARVPVP